MIPVLRRVTVIALAVVASACGDTNAGGTDAGVNCPAGQVVKFDPDTGAPKCVDDNDLGNISGKDGQGLGDGSGSTDDGSGGTGDGSGGKDSGLATGDSDTGIGTGDGSEGDGAGSTCKPGATGLERWWGCAPVPGTTGALHGQKCEKDADCLYGFCFFGSPLAGYDKAIGICTKNCGYSGGAYTTCTKEDTVVDKYYCTIEKTAQVGNPKQDTKQPGPFKMCGHGCKTDADCAAWNADLPNCLKNSTKYLSTNPNGVCAKAIPE